MIDSWTKFGLGSRSDDAPPRGDCRNRVHREGARTVGATRGSTAGRRRRLDAGVRSGGGRRARRRTALRVGRRAGGRPGRRRRPPLHAESSSPAARRGCAGSGEARDLREAARARRRRGATARRRRGGVGKAGGRAVRLPVLPDRARGARASCEWADRCPSPAARHVPAGLAAARRRRQLARGRAAGRRVARVRRHRLALVRPRRVRLRPSHRARLGAPADRRAGASQRGRSRVRDRSEAAASCAR